MKSYFLSKASTFFIISSLLSDSLIIATIDLRMIFINLSSCAVFILLIFYSFPTLAILFSKFISYCNYIITY